MWCRGRRRIVIRSGIAIQAPNRLRKNGNKPRVYVGADRGHLRDAVCPRLWSNVVQTPSGSLGVENRPRIRRLEIPTLAAGGFTLRDLRPS
jgi:hypothetical protein